ncbi:hypothetical protein ADUPG1_006380 [Aduncisulcus paluster]|uniref:Uncharacterized protein n=1 Tax=Aduncisulcus paluster TaxID=2918883 RepID=A0ABQ5KLI0_9EUKA|nr:hypothetical protein ADUPG1_006380 [Aduncisulcus paluster]
MLKRGEMTKSEEFFMDYLVEFQREIKAFSSFGSFDVVKIFIKSLWPKRFGDRASEKKKKIKLDPLGSPGDTQKEDSKSKTKGKPLSDFGAVIVAARTEWVELVAAPSTTAISADDAIFGNIFCRFGAPHQIRSDNGTQSAASHISSSNHLHLFKQSLKPTPIQGKRRHAEEVIMLKMLKHGMSLNHISDLFDT